MDDFEKNAFKSRKTIHQGAGYHFHKTPFPTAKCKYLSDKDHDLACWACRRLILTSPRKPRTKFNNPAMCFYEAYSYGGVRYGWLVDKKSNASKPFEITIINKCYV